MKVRYTTTSANTRALKNSRRSAAGRLSLGVHQTIYWAWMRSSHTSRIFSTRPAAQSAAIASGARPRVAYARLAYGAGGENSRSICAICGAPMQSANANSATAIEAAASESRCTDCVDRPPNFARARAVARYRPAAESDHRSLPSLIRRHKYGLDQSLQKALGEFLGQELPFSTADCDLVIPVPLHRRRLWWRGFNQAALLARTIARRLDKPLELGALVRCG